MTYEKYSMSFEKISWSIVCIFEKIQPSEVEFAPRHMA